ncbi:2TM domain-containing protein [Candidatus Dependentiae bacterium]|nr:2TM domain-containing protein [Candidatus Dependentiae bacterium]
MDKNNTERDPLWAVAQERVQSKLHIYSFIVLNAVLWLIWLCNNLWKKAYDRSFYWEFPWPLYVMLMWGSILFLRYIKLYSKYGKNAVAEEYTKLKKTEEYKKIQKTVEKDISDQKVP